MQSQDFILLAALGLGALCLYKQQKPRENFFNTPGFSVRTEKVAQDPSNNVFYSVPGTFQSSLSPRFSNLDYGGAIRKRPTALKNQAVDPNDPLSYGTSLTEGYGGCRTGSGNQTSASAARMNGGVSATPVNMLPLNNPVTESINALGEIVNQPIIYDRYIYANKKSPNTFMGDPIRGDLPILPNDTNKWFASRYNSPLDLRSGALAVIGGLDNDTSKQLMVMQNMASGQTLDVGSGIAYSVVGNNVVSGAQNDIQVTSFPV